MYKVFIVEDEEILREGMKNNVKWEENGYEYCGDAKDGEEALILIRKFMPDIVITDIKMPFMNGLELSKIIKDERSSTKIIMLTAYDEFDFAREAISIVADEIRKLAEQSNIFTGKIDIIINELREKTDFAVEKMKDANENVESQNISLKETNKKFEGISSSIENLNQIVEEFEASMKELVLKKNEITSVMNSLASISTENASGAEKASKAVEQIAEASTSLANLAEELQTEIGKFKV
ncbi:MAG: response regulator [Leptotrichiaceae bacterium]|nr:response regulator [Leptotrichiaceae bacterium]